MIKKTKKINCKVCGVECYSGKGSLCTVHYNLAQKEKRKVKKKETQKLNRKLGNITEARLWTLFSSLIKDIYPLYCHACYIPLKKGTKQCQACHILPRGKQVLKWDIRNVYPGCDKCNGFDPTHIIELARNADQYWGKGTSDMIRERRHEIKKWSQNQFNALRQLFKYPPIGKDAKETRELILAEYLKIYEGNF